MIRVLKAGVLFVAIACGIVSGSWGQQDTTKSSDVSALLGKLHSPSGAQRSEAFEAIRANPGNLKSLRVRRALFDLLDRENHELDARLADAQKKGYPDQEGSDGEGFGIYYSELLDTVNSFANWSDPHEACILVEAASSDDSVFAAKVVDHASTTIPCLLKKATSPVSMNRAVGVPVLVQALAKAKNIPDPGTVQRATQIVQAALQDPDEGVRTFTVHALAKFGAEDMIPALKKVAESDQSPEIQGRSIKKAAAEAITAIQQRAVQH